MRLAIIRDDNTLVVVLEGIEHYDLSKPLAKAEICLAIAETMALMETQHVHTLSCGFPNCTK